MDFPSSSTRPADPALRMRPFLAADLDFADTLRAEVGWNQTRRDWRRFLALEPDGCHVAELDGNPVGTATTTRHGDARTGIAWIGMVLVSTPHRRRGVGRALLRHCLDALRKQGSDFVRLDATPEGRPVYQDLGFRDDWTLARWQGTSPSAEVNSPSNARPTPGPATNLAELRKLDTTAFGVSRHRLLAALSADAPFLVVRDPEGVPVAFGQSRPGARARYLGPIVAANAGVGTRLVGHLLGEFPGTPFFWDIPESNGAAAAMARGLGFIPQRTLTRMTLDLRGHTSAPRPARLPDRPEWQWALAGPEVG